MVKKWRKIRQTRKGAMDMSSGLVRKKIKLRTQWFIEWTKDEFSRREKLLIRMDCRAVLGKKSVYYTVTFDEALLARFDNIEQAHEYMEKKGIQEVWEEFYKKMKELKAKERVEFI